MNSFSWLCALIDFLLGHLDDLSLLFSPNSINAIRGKEGACTDQYRLRKEVSILVVDDEKPLFQDTLTARGFNITWTPDLTNLEASEGHPIVIMDIRGVGHRFSDTKEGAALIKEIRNREPAKIIFTISAYLFDPSYNEYVRLSDVSLMKSTTLDIEFLIEKLDEGICLCFDPVKAWRRAEMILSNKGINSRIVTKIERRFVLSYLKQDSRVLSRFLKRILTRKNSSFRLSVKDIFAKPSLLFNEGQ